MPTTSLDTLKVHFAVCETIPTAKTVGQQLMDRYGQTEPEFADRIVVLGGDGFMLRTIHQLRKYQKPFYGINYGSVGFLMNSEIALETLPQRLDEATPTQVNLLKMEVTTTDGSVQDFWAFNEVSLFRETYQAGKFSISVNGKIRLEELISDGLLVATPAGSTAYNFSSHGPILPMGSGVLALTPLSAFRPRRWRGAILPHDVIIRVDVLDPQKRPVSAAADDQAVGSVASVTILEDKDVHVVLLFDAQHNLEERILAEQFYVV